MSLAEYAPVQNESLPKVAPISIERRPNGVTIERVSVWDESEGSETFPETRRQLDVWDSELASMDHPLPPVFHKETRTVTPRNPISEIIYKEKCIQEWGNLMPTAQALHYLTHSDETVLPSGEPISENMKRFMREMDDGIGIRTRKAIAYEIVKKTLESSSDGAQCLSLACGAADLMLEAVSETYGRAFLHLVDYDDETLRLAEINAENEGLVLGENYEFVGVVADEADHDKKEAGRRLRDLRRSMIATNTLVRYLGENSQRVVDAIGINEYFSDKAAMKFLANAYATVEPGGVLVTANMLKSRPQMLINKLAIGWTDDVKPRSLDELMAMLESAGLPLNCTTFTIPEDGIYAVMRITKPRMGSLHAS